MASKPKQKDYKPTEGEKASAAVGKAEYDWFKSQYVPELIKERDASKQDNSSLLRGRANADTMQALTKNTSLASVNRVGDKADTANALLGQLGLANENARKVQNKRQTNVLGIARGQAADAQTGMSQASRMSASSALARARNRQDVAQSKINAAAQIGSSFVSTGLANLAGGSDTFFAPNKDGELKGNVAQNVNDRLQVGLSRLGF